tara:strand:- start:12 stop:704 length:693 start_codon:yes stop_codon:yes gene_type:complete
MDAKVYNYPSQSNVYAIDTGNKIYNLVLNYEGDDFMANSYLKGGIVQFKDFMDIGDIKTHFPNDMLMNPYENYDLQTNDSIVYDMWKTKDGVTFTYKDYSLNINNLNKVYPEEIEITAELTKTILEIKTNVEKLKTLYNKDDFVLQSQWFMDYVDFSKFKDMNVRHESREKEISTIISTILKLSDEFQINNNHQMKLLFQILFNSKDTCISHYELEKKELLQDFTIADDV